MTLTRRLLLAGGLAGLTAACESAKIDLPESSGASLTRPGAKLDRQQAVDLVNSFRRSNGLGTLALDSHLSALAEEQARTMASAGRLSHEVGGDLPSRLRRGGYRFATAGENIAAGQDTLVDVFGGWRASPGHRSVMLSGDATRMGIAAVQAPNSAYKIFWAMIVARPPES
ncbi:CAP domain-containing protein [Blastochloris sulfoviridis]|uniref:CAP domain-containing protein n=1 Tax=Blastochloris sulfoviridis TaxID=50712 RepID=A0A5M6I598_9HYPH|nr:CAP domain-containing protein [Blastochloris sulfoviridis]KAA5603400.1 CAP domain-containing protein [Blastochloris sulfoviridis]